MVTRHEVEAAYTRTSGWVRHTPLAESGNREAYHLWFKCEYMQHTGSFKTRGAFNRLLTAQEDGALDPVAGIVVASGGNAGLANAYAAAKLGVPATVFVPESAPANKVHKLYAIGAHVVQGGAEYAEAYAAAVSFAEEKGAVYCHAYDQPEIVAGAGGVGLELLDELPDVDSILVAVGGGGLMGGIAAAVEGKAQVVGVEPENVPTLHTALAQGEPVDVAVSGVAADSLGARRIGGIGFDVARRAGVQSVLVSDELIIKARRRLWEDHRIVVEHGAAAAYAALLSGAHTPNDGETVAVVLCGANTDPAHF
ncbi:threonine/serine dehydratase [Paenarthrobacter ilicis]|uniref:Threonine dehydratase n=1 Tax=Paenarthrobacter ilicis TaxID=43665 RepID=A0ABX0TKU7_9MICC|nr:threonine/serine dehydratase [Paenarthrobacter ilicis]MBM7794656.1 threonine dehydratase [Paenarthrobacter ilicis]NIJ02480.1 threonine dehydratase [Paenarthrobacter ilicis]